MVSAAELTTPAPAFTWRIPPGWRAETIPFPLDFAPALPYRGVEELRFAPRFFDPLSPTYFTYSFAFVLEWEAAITPEVFGADLETYFAGLASAVTGAPSDPSLHEALVVRADDGEEGHFRGNVRTIDAFGDRRPLSLHLEAETFGCGARRIVIASLSPLAPATPIWSEMATLRHDFTCSGGRR